MPITVVEDWKALPSLRPAWDELDKNGAVTSPFMSFAWIDQWGQHRAGHLRPFILVSSSGDWIAPFGISRRQGVRVIQFLGAPDSDFPGIVTAQPQAEAWARLAQELRERRKDWDLLHLDSVSERDEILASLSSELGSRGIERRYETCPWIPISGSFDDLCATRGRDLRKNVKRWKRRVEEQGSVRIAAFSPPVVPTVLDELVDVEQDSWKWRQGDAHLRPGPLRDFIMGLLMDPRMNLRLWTLRIDERLVGFAIVLHDHMRWHYYLASFRSEATHVGSHLLAEIIKEASSSECSSVELLRGAIDYKYAWTDHEREVHEIAWSTTISGDAVRRLIGLRWRLARSPLARRIRSRLLGVGDRRENTQSRVRE